MSASSAAATPVHAFADRAWGEFLEHDPMWATTEGIETWDDRLDDPTPEGRVAFMAMVNGWDAEVTALASGDLSEEEPSPSA
jgi:hypothetical protein